MDLDGVVLGMATDGADIPIMDTAAIGDITPIIMHGDTLTTAMGMVTAEEATTLIQAVDMLYVLQVLRYVRKTEVVLTPV